MANNLHRRIRFGLFEFTPETGDLRREGTAVKIAPQPARVLALLVSRPGDVILRDEFRQALWGDDTFVDFERGLNFCITQVRTALGDSSDNPRFVQTVPRRGYRFIAPVAEIAGESPRPPTPPLRPPTPPSSTSDPARRATSDPDAATSDPDAATSDPASRGRASLTASRMWTAAAVLALLAGGWYGLGIVRSSNPTNAMTHASQPLRIAVLPIANLSGDASADYIADGLTDELITQLGTIGGDRLAVIARTSAMAYRASAKPLPDIARELNVQYIVESALRRQGETLRVNGSLVAVSTQSAVARWEEVVDTTTSTPETNQARAAIRIARHAATELIPNVDAEATATTTTPEAWERYLQATAAIERGTPSSVRQAITELEAAVAHDPQFAAGWARLAETRHLLVMMGSAAPETMYPHARKEIELALASAPQSPSAHLARGLVQLWYDWRPADAAASFERALSLNPSLAAAHHDYAWALVALGRTDDAIRHIVKARDLDPVSTRANNDVGWLYLQIRQPENAAQACQTTLAIDAKSLEAQACLERAFADRQLFDAAFQAARATLPAGEDLAAHDNASARDRLHTIWTWRLRRLEEAAASRWVSPHSLAVHYVLTGDHDRALDALEDAYRARVGALVLMARDPALAPLRNDARFAALLQKITAPPS